MSEEEWRYIDGTAGVYLVSNRGRVRSQTRYEQGGHSGTRRRAGRILKPYVGNDCAHRRVDLCPREQFGQRYVADLVLEAFAGPPPPGMVARHRSNDLQDDRWPENLYWGPPQPRKKRDTPHEQRNP